MNNIDDFKISFLGFLSLKPMHGYELHKQVTDLSGFGIVWKIKIGKLYTMLNKLEKEGLIKSTFTKEGNRPVRNEFSITPTGENIYETWLISPVNRGRDFRIIFLLKLYFSLRNGIESANKLIGSQIETCNRWLSERIIRNQESLILRENDENDFPIIVNKYRQIQIQGYLTWLEWCKESLK
ncbi:MAG: PadR family transcriptional regulator [Pelolinea sp.]|nr:PadR family transcriptional regulator [Pelolinea sp.]